MTAMDLSPDATPTAESDAPPAETSRVERTIDIVAAPERVFDALTDPDALAAWWGDASTYRTHDWTIEATPGGHLHAQTTDARGAEGVVDGEYRVVDRPHVLEHTWRPSWEDRESLVRYDIEPAIVHGVPGTRVTVTHTARRQLLALALAA